MASLSIIIEQFTADRLEGRCTEWGTLPRPGSFIQFTTASNAHFYAQVVSLRYISGETQGLMLGMRPVAGMPDSRIRESRQISQAEYFDVTHGPAPLQIPLKSDELVLDLADSGKVVYAKPSSAGVHKALIQGFHNAGLPIIVVDPVGLDLGAIPSKELTFGPKGLQLSIQDVGVSQFIQWVVNALPPSAQARASEDLLQTIPPTADFIPLQYFVDHPALKASPLSSAILHPLYHFHSHSLFASKVKQALNLNKLDGVHHFNLSTLPPELLSIAYAGILRSLYRHGLAANTQVVLVAPEVEPEFARTFTQHTRNRVFLMSTHLQPWQDLVTDSWDEVRLFGEEGIEIKGNVTHGLTLFASAQTFQTILPAVPSVAIAPTPVAITEAVVVPIEVEAASEEAEEETPASIVITPPTLPEDVVPVPHALALPALQAPSIAPVMDQMIEGLEPTPWDAITEPETKTVTEDVEPDLAEEMTGPSAADAMAMLAAATQADLDLPVLEEFPDEETDEPPFMPDTETGEEAESLEPETLMLPEMPAEDTPEPTSFMAPPPLELPAEQTPVAEPPEGEQLLSAPGILAEGTLENALDTSLAAPFTGLDFLFDEASLPPAIPKAAEPIVSAAPEPVTPTTGEDNAWALDALSSLEPQPEEISMPVLESEPAGSDTEFSLGNDGLDFDFDDMMAETSPSSEPLPIEDEEEEILPLPPEEVSHLASLMDLAAEHEAIGDLSVLPEVGEGAVDVNADLDASLVSDPNLELETEGLELDLPDLGDLSLDAPMGLPSLKKEAPSPQPVAAGNDDNLDALSALEMLDTPASALDTEEPDEMELPMVFDLDQPVLMDTSLPPGSTAAYAIQQDDNESALMSLEAIPTLPPPAELSVSEAVELSLDLDDDVFAFETEEDTLIEAEPELSSEEPPLEIPEEALEPLVDLKDVSESSAVPELRFDFDALDALTEEPATAAPATESEEELSLDFDLDFSFPDVAAASETIPAAGGIPSLPEEKPVVSAEESLFPILGELDDLPPAPAPLPQAPEPAQPTMAVEEVFSILDELESHEAGIPSLPDDDGIPEQALPVAEAPAAPTEPHAVEEAVELDDVFADIDGLDLTEKPSDQEETFFPSFDMPAEAHQSAMSTVDAESLGMALDKELAMLEPEESPELELGNLDFDLDLDNDPMPVQSQPVLNLDEEFALPEEIPFSQPPEPMAEDETEDLLALLDEPVSLPEEPELSNEISWEEDTEMALELDFALPEATTAQAPAAPPERPPIAAGNDDWDLDFDLELPAEPIGTDGASDDNLLPDFTWEEAPAEPDSPNSTEESSEAAIPIYKNLVENETPAAYEAGQQVIHKRYGPGVIKRVIVMNDDQIILNVVFDSVGKRLLDPKLTQLEKVG